MCPSKRTDVNECIAELQCPLYDGRVYRWSKVKIEGSEQTLLHKDVLVRDPEILGCVGLSFWRNSRSADLYEFWWISLTTNIHL